MPVQDVFRLRPTQDILYGLPHPNDDPRPDSGRGVPGTGKQRGEVVISSSSVNKMAWLDVLRPPKSKVLVGML